MVLSGLKVVAMDAIDAVDIDMAAAVDAVLTDAVLIGQSSVVG